MNSILLIEDDVQLSEMTCAYLELCGLKVTAVPSANDCWSLLESKTFDLIILDLGLPDEDGLVLLRKIRAQNCDTPIIVSSGRASDEDKIAGLEFGANDYLAKPYKVKELMLRIKILLKSTQLSESSINLVKLGVTSLNLVSHELVNSDGHEIALTAHEYAVLKFLVKNAPRTHSRAAIIDATHLEEGPESSRAVDTIICRLRKKVEIDPKKPTVIKTVNGVGYKVITG